MLNKPCCDNHAAKKEPFEAMPCDEREKKQIIMTI